VKLSGVDPYDVVESRYPDRIVVIDLRSVTELSLFVPAPTLHGASIDDRARMRAPRGDCADAR